MKRIYAMLLILCMVLAILPITALAAESGGEPIAPASDSGMAVATASETGTDETGTADSSAVSENIPEPTVDSSDTTGEPSETSLPEESGVGEDTDLVPPESGENVGDPEIIPPEPNGGEPLPEVIVPADAPNVQITPFNSGWGEDGESYFTKIRLTVTDMDGNPVYGAVFGLYSADGTFIQQLTSDYYGIALSSDVPVNTDYYLKEITAPEGYQSLTERKDILLTEVCAPSRVDVTAEYDPITGNIEVIKVDENGDPLPGVSFYVYHNGNFMDSVTTDDDGRVYLSGLRYGSYEFYEYAAPFGYTTGDSYYAWVTEQDAVAPLEITNYLARGDAEIQKTGNDGRAISGAVFSIHNADTDAWIEDVTTNYGYAYTGSLVVGTYYAQEKNVPAPYALNTEKHFFSIDYSGERAYLSIQNVVDGESGAIKVIKTDERDNPLSGVVFGVYRAWDGQKITQITTDADGIAEYGPLIPQDYYLVELSGKDGYEMTTGQIPFTVDGSGETVECTVLNPKIRIFGKVQVIKLDDENAPIPGVRFGLYCSRDNLLEELVTGADGKATSGVLNEGEYYLVELEGVAGYLSNDTQHNVSITQNGVTVPVTVVNPRVSGAVKVIKTGEDGEPLAGVVFGIYKNDALVGEITTGEDGTATSGTLYYGDYTLVELSTVEGYELIDTAIPFSILLQGVTLEIPVTNPLIFGEVLLLKTGVNDAPLFGAVFGLYNADDQKIAELTTDENGEAGYAGLPKGLYYLLEQTAPEGYLVSDEPIAFAVQTQGQFVSLTAHNELGYGIVEVVKTGENDEPLCGVTFDVFRSATDEKVGELATGKDGKATLELPLGRYYLVETATAEGYRLPESSFSVVLTENGGIVSLSIQNQREPQPQGGTVTLTKTDENSEPLSGAKFGIYRASDDDKVSEITSGEDGTATSIALPEGEYYLKELEAPTGFTLSEDKYPVTITEGGNAAITVTNTALPVVPDDPDTGTVIIIKKSEKDGSLLSGAVFAVYRTADNAKMGELTTGEDGTASMEIAPGDYYLLETRAPDGFKASDERIGLRVKIGETKEITVLNATSTGTLIITKTDKVTGEKLAGALFGIFDKDSKKLAEITIGKDGTATADLAPGEYFLRELEAPIGYALNLDRVSVTIKAGETTKVTITNTPLAADETGELLVIKKAEGTGKPLSGAVFGVYRASDNRKLSEITTGADGTVTLALTPGDYYLLEQTAPSGYALETARISFTVRKGVTVKVEITNMLIGQDKPTPAPTTPANPSIPGISIPKTGEDFPAMNYVLASLLLCLAVVCGAALYRDRKRAA